VYIYNAIKMPNIIIITYLVVLHVMLRLDNCTTKYVILILGIIITLYIYSILTYYSTQSISILIILT